MPSRRDASARRRPADQPSIYAIVSANINVASSQIKSDNLSILQNRVCAASEEAAPIRGIRLQLLRASGATVLVAPSVPLSSPWHGPAYQDSVTWALTTCSTTYTQSHYLLYPPVSISRRGYHLGPGLRRPLLMQYDQQAVSTQLRWLLDVPSPAEEMRRGSASLRCMRRARDIVPLQR